MQFVLSSKEKIKQVKNNTRVLRVSKSTEDAHEEPPLVVSVHLYVLFRYISEPVLQYFTLYTGHFIACL